MVIWATVGAPLSFKQVNQWLTTRLAGNLHLNVTSRQPDDNLLALIEPFVYEFTGQLLLVFRQKGALAPADQPHFTPTANVRGSISAEHGLGVMKPEKIVGVVLTALGWGVSC
jgi:hypothetical protein